MFMHVITIPGNLFSAAEVINKNKLAEWVRALSYSSNYTQVVLVLPDGVFKALLDAKKIW